MQFRGKQKHAITILRFKFSIDFSIYAAKCMPRPTAAKLPISKIIKKMQLQCISRPIPPHTVMIYNIQDTKWPQFTLSTQKMLSLLAKQITSDYNVQKIVFFFLIFSLCLFTIFIIDSIIPKYICMYIICYFQCSFTDSMWKMVKVLKNLNRTLIEL